MPQYQAPDGRIIESDNELDATGLAAVFKADLTSRVDQHAQALGVPTPLALGLAETESGLRHAGDDGKLTSNPKSSARGLYQLTDAARKDAGVKGDSIDDHIQGGLKYLKMKADEHNGDWGQAVAAYKQGTGSLNKEGATPETQAYQQKVQQFSDSWAKTLGRGALKMGGAIGGGIAGTVAMPELPVGGTALGSMWGYSLGHNMANTLGLEPPSKVPDSIKNLEDTAVVGAGTAGGAAGGVSGFAGGTEAAQTIVNELNKRAFGIDYKAPSEASDLTIGGKKPLDFPYGQAVQDMGTNALIDMGGRLGIKGLERFSGVKAAEGQVKGVVDEASAKHDAEANAFEGKATGAINRTQDLQQIAQQQALSAHDESQPAIEKKVSREFGPQVAEQQYAQLLGKSPQDVAAARVIDPTDGGVPTEATALNRKQVADAVFEPVKRIQKSLGDEYEQLLGPHRDNAAELEPLNTGVRQQMDFLIDHNLQGNLSRDTRELMAHATRMSHPESKATIGDLLSLRSRASALSNSATESIDRSTAANIVQHTQSALAESGVEMPALKALNTRYKYFKDTFRKVLGPVGKEIDPEDWGGRFFGNREAAIRTFDSATAPEKDALRSALGTYVYGKKDVRGALNSLGEETLSRYFGNTAYGKARTWLEVEPKLADFSKVLAASPTAKTAFLDRMHTRANEIANDYGEKMVKSALALASKIGPEGKRIEQEIFKAPSRQAKQQIATKFLDEINPQRVTDEFRKAQPSVSELATQAFAKLPKSAYGAALGHQALRSAAIAAAEYGMHGSVGYYPMAAIAYSGVMLPREIVKTAFMNSLRNPKAARAFIAAVQSGSLDKFAAVAADDFAASLTQKGQQQ